MTFAVTILLWGGVSFVIYFINPFSTLAIPLFFSLLFLALLFTLSIILINKRRGLIATAAIILFLSLRLFGVGNLLNFLLIIGVATAVEMYFSGPKFLT